MEEELSVFSNEGKAAWLELAKVRIPIGTPIRVRDSEEEEYIGLRGTVVDYDVGDHEEWPLVSVLLIPPENSAVEAIRELFYCDGDEDDEIVKELM